MYKYFKNSYKIAFLLIFILPCKVFAFDIFSKKTALDQYFKNPEEAVLIIEELKVEVYESKDDNLNISLDMKDFLLANLDYKSNFKNNKLNFEIKKKKKKVFDLSPYVLKVYLPASLKKADFYVESNSILLKDLEKGRLIMINSSGGDASITNFSGELNILNTSGKTEVENLYGSLYLVSYSGAINVKNSEGLFLITSEGGELTMQNSSGKFTLENGYGNITCESVDLRDDSSFYSISGKINIILKDGITKYKFILSSKSGDLQIGTVKRKTNFEYGNGNIKIIADSDSGGQTIDFY